MASGAASAPPGRWHGSATSVSMSMTTARRPAGAGARRASARRSSTSGDERLTGCSPYRTRLRRRVAPRRPSERGPARPKPGGTRPGALRARRPRAPGGLGQPEGPVRGGVLGPESTASRAPASSSAISAHQPRASPATSSMAVPGGDEGAPQASASRREGRSSSIEGRRPPRPGAAMGRRYRRHVTGQHDAPARRRAGEASSIPVSPQPGWPATTRASSGWREARRSKAATGRHALPRSRVPTNAM